MNQVELLYLWALRCWCVSSFQRDEDNLVETFEFNTSADWHLSDDCALPLTGWLEVWHAFSYVTGVGFELEYMQCCVARCTWCQEQELVLRNCYVDTNHVGCTVTWWPQTWGDLTFEAGFNSWLQWLQWQWLWWLTNAMIASIFFLLIAMARWRNRLVRWTD